MNIKSEKEALRREIKQLLKKRLPEKNIACPLHKVLSGFEPYREAASVLLYAALPEEAPTLSLIELCLAHNKITALPKVTGKDMDFFILNPKISLAKQTERGSFGILEPVGSCPLFVPSHAELPVTVFVPGLAFDTQGHRLGRGGGYYDRYYARLKAEENKWPQKEITFIGYCRNMQIVQHIPAEKHDLRVDFIMTEYGIKKTISAGR